ncbi:MAG: hypothetical protein IH951_11615 [Bacteroidetes bacterium]|nr:hypothetical protein [Bacteroidota bacterium]
MKIEVMEDNTLVLKEAFNGVKFETDEGHCIWVYLRDDTIEINVLPKGELVPTHNWWRVDMQAGVIKSLSETK